MSLGIIGKKVGMTRVFNDKGESVPVTVINVEPNIVAQVKTTETDGYNAVQITTGGRKASKVSAPAAGHFKKAGVEAGAITREFRTDQEFNAGDTLELSMFEDGQKVRVTGTSKGKGFQGVIKRYNFHMQDATHGNSLSHRAPGSIGQCQTPGRVFKGKKMSGHMGAERVTTKNLEVVRVDQENNLLLIKGAVPGAKTSTVIVRPLV
ncbi:50S ribosomal protein L3 [Marinicella meishanensis]|uniref:50S ribosomal protein L3 n=1 Tax=Marinicella meishanensis TaxID=2873263 RepID=UPI001CBD4CBB|nr:50S ribosomal protein L3 [Marinicella sp. NBU2979]